MLAKINRLSKRKDFAAIYQSGYRATSVYYNIRFLNNGLTNSRIAVVVSNKVSTKAVVRNKLRRQVREIIIDNLNKFRQNLDIIITVYSRSVDKKYSELSDDLIKLLAKNKII